jgi:hypothetical protein
VVHIDLGIAFEQGLFLQTPERVPFRLTQNVVDGMGAAGTEGTFRRCCETALQVRIIYWIRAGPVELTGITQLLIMNGALHAGHSSTAR